MGKSVVLTLADPVVLDAPWIDDRVGRDVQRPRQPLFAALAARDLLRPAALRWALWGRDWGSRLLWRRGAMERPLHALPPLGEAAFYRRAPERLQVAFDGAFWLPLAPIERLAGDAVQRPIAPGTARVLWDFTVTEVDARRSHLCWAITVQAGDAAARRHFARYWSYARWPNRGLRRWLLRRLASAAELSLGQEAEHPIQAGQGDGAIKEGLGGAGDPFDDAGQGVPRGD